jgi:CheY-like chemotaxis protein
VAPRPSLDADLLRGVHVMVVDDDDDARELFHAVLECCGAEVVAVESATEALRTLPTVRADVIVSDIVMPGQDGYALLRSLRRQETWRDVPVLALTAYGLAHHHEAVLAAGFTAYLKKPVEPWDLCRAVDRLRRPDG